MNYFCDLNYLKEKIKSFQPRFLKQHEKQNYNNCFIRFSFDTNVPQQQNIIKADKDYANYAYIDAIETYEHIFIKGINQLICYKN
jgi:hypothetical protein